MTMVTFITHDGREFSVAASDGASLMENAVRNDVPGIVARCGGACACGTCHVHVDPAWFDRLARPSLSETDTLDFVFDRRETSRLSCQIEVRPDLDGLVLHVPSAQAE